MFSIRPDNLPSVLFQPSLTVLSLSVGLVIFYMRAVPQYSFYFFIDVLVKNTKYIVHRFLPIFAVKYVLTGLDTLFGSKHFNI